MLDGDFRGTFPFESRFLRAGKTNLHYVDEGPADAAPLLFLHGNGAHADWWSFIAPFFAAEYRVAALSWSGMGGRVSEARA